ncbi:MAG: PilT protein domain protein [Rhizobium sp.]|nr:PilT protein domain protein [Rhizobium sp.]
MFLDASIVVAILAQEDDWEMQSARLAQHRGRLFHSPMVRFEASIALAIIGQVAANPRSNTELVEGAEQLFDAFMSDLGSSEVNITPQIGRGALVAARRYGKTAGHKAALNFGDCFSYAAAKSLGVGLLYKGNDFALTDLGE